MAEQVVLGVDGGGTKTDVIVVTGHGQVVGFASGGGANWEGVGLDAVEDVLHRLVTAAVDRAGLERSDLHAAAYCLAGVDWPSDLDRLEPRVEALDVNGPRLVENDSFAALRAGAPSGFGCVSIAGTGGVTAGRDRHGHRVRTMGIGIGEGAGAGGLVMEALAAMAAEHHCSGPPTAITERILTAAGSDTVPELFEGLSRGTLHVGGDLAVEVLDASREGDPVARQIARRCGAQHGRDAAGVAERLGLQETFDLVLAGGVHVAGEAEFRSGFTDEVGRRCPMATLRVLAAPPAAGAALLALELLGIDTARLHDRVCHEATAARAQENRA